MKRRIAAIVAFAALLVGASAPAYADAGGGPGSNSGCAGQQPPPPPSGGCGH